MRITVNTESDGCVRALEYFQNRQTITTATATFPTSNIVQLKRVQFITPIARHTIRSRGALALLPRE